MKLIIEATKTYFFNIFFDLSDKKKSNILISILFIFIHLINS